MREANQDLEHETESRKVRGYCALCTAHCATIASVEQGRVVSLDADYDHPNGGVMCIKGKAAPELVYNPDRLNYPLKRTRPKGESDPGWQRVSWGEALDEIATRLKTIRERYGAKALALAKGTKSGTSVDDVERWLGRFLNSFGSPNWVSTTHVCNWHKDTGFSYTFGANIPTPDLANSKTFLLWGHNPSATSLILAHDIAAARARGMKTVVIDPRRIGIGARADMLLQPRPGTDGALALAMIHCFLDEGWYDAALGTAVDQRTVSDRYPDKSSSDGSRSRFRWSTESIRRVGSVKRAIDHLRSGHRRVRTSWRAAGAFRRAFDQGEKWPRNLVQAGL